VLIDTQILDFDLNFFDYDFFIIVLNILLYFIVSESFWELMLDCIYVMVSEMLIDWTKHAFITRFNEINLSVYSDYILSFAYDTAQSRHRKVIIHNEAIC